jgi:catechol 2,3-dioxygenase-like lactoylglutathione lyase family enzyme
MKQSVSFVTIGVNDLPRMKQFYTEAFGWKPVKDVADMLLFAVGGCMLALYPANQLALEIGLESWPAAGEGAGRLMAFAINLDSREEVEHWFAQCPGKGVRVVRLPEMAKWGGYRGFIADPENNYWEIVWNPHWKHPQP